MQVPISNPLPKQSSELEIVRLEFTTKRLGMEWEYNRFWEMTEKSESDAQVHEHKA